MRNTKLIKFNLEFNYANNKLSKFTKENNVKY